MLDERKLAVLRAIVEDYVSSHEPVGSRTIVERHGLGVSPATIRNDMAALEDEGYIAQPHTSAGRIPTDKGYRLFVDRLSTVKPLHAAERKAIDSFLAGAVDLDDVVHRTVRILAQLTQMVAVVQYPSLTRTVVRHVELLALTPQRVLLVLITTSGRVEQRVLDFDDDITEATLSDLRARINAVTVGSRFAEVADAVTSLPGSVPPDQRFLAERLVAALLETMVEDHEERVVLAGTANLARFGHDFPMTVQPVLDALEEQVVLLRLLGEATNTDSPLVRIGHENLVEGLTGASVVTAGYGDGFEAVAHLGVVGPTRMDYPGTIRAVRAVAQYLSRSLSES